jgi:hypothetical protein
MKFNFRKLILLLIIGLLLWSIGAKYISQHEFIHQKIFERHNIVSISKINYLTLNGVTIPERDCPECAEENNLNDVTGYNTALIIYALVVLGLINLIIKKWD